MATFVVTTMEDEDGGSGGTGLSLREAITLANANAGADTVAFATGLVGGTILIEETKGALQATEDLSIIGDIDGNDTPDITLDGHGATQILSVSASTEVDGLTFANGQSVNGGAIEATATLTVINSPFHGNSADNLGGAIRSGADLVIRQSTFSDNHAVAGGGGISGINATIDGSTFSGHTAHHGGAIWVDIATISSSTFEGNTAVAAGGAVYSLQATITSSSFENNNAVHGGALRTISSSTILSADITSSTFTGNTATGLGGAIYADGNLTGRNSTFHDNTASTGAAAVAFGDIDLIDGTATANVGAAVFASAQTISVWNSIILGNTGLPFDALTVGLYDVNIIETGSDDTVFVVDANGNPLLTDNGGPVKTIALNPDASNPAIDQGGFTTDARGDTAYGTGDLGAYEYTGTRAVSIDSTSPNGSYWLGDTISITIRFDQVVTVTGTPKLLLETGSTDRQASYSSGSGTDTLTFTYTVQSGDSAADLNFQSMVALSLDGGAITGPSGNAALVLPTTGGGQSLAAQASIAVSGVLRPTAPVLASPTADKNATEDTAFSFALPAGMFTDASGDTITLTASLAGGAALPSWLSFNASTRTFSGTPVNGDVGKIDILVTAPMVH